MQVRIVDSTGTINEKIEKLAQLLANSEEGMKGVNELQFICDNVSTLGLQTAFLDLDVTLARGLNYYTGAIFEVKSLDAEMGSICGGGRYDDLTAQFGLKDVSGIGISFGADRIYDVLNDLRLFPDSTESSISYLILNFGGEDTLASLDLASEIRSKGHDCELYPTNVKIQKQFKYADARNARFVIMIGEDERNSNEITIKNMKQGTQERILRSEFLASL